MNFNTKNIIHDKEEMLKLFSLAYAENLNHVNQNNYINQEKRLNGYISFDVAYLDDDIVAFSGLWTNDKWAGCVRAVDRYYIFKKYRSKSLSANYITNIASKLFIPAHFKTATTLNLYPFVSIQKGTKSLKIIKNNLKNLHNLDCVILKKLRFTCMKDKDITSKTCWQSILTLKSCYNKVDSALPMKTNFTQVRGHHVR